MIISSTPCVIQIIYAHFLHCRHFIPEKTRKVVAAPSHRSHGWCHSLTISKTIHGELLLSAMSVREKYELKERNSQSDLMCRLGWYIADFLALATGKRKVMKTYDCVLGSFEKAGYRRKHRRASDPTKTERWKTVEQRST